MGDVNARKLYYDYSINAGYANCACRPCENSWFHIRSVRWPRKCVTNSKIYDIKILCNYYPNMETVSSGKSQRYNHFAANHSHVQFVSYFQGVLNVEALGQYTFMCVLFFVPAHGVCNYTDVLSVVGSTFVFLMSYGMSHVFTCPIDLFNWQPRETNMQDIYRYRNVVVDTSISSIALLTLDVIWQSLLCEVLRNNERIWVSTWLGIRAEPAMACWHVRFQRQNFKHSVLQDTKHV
jgi:hypothetical protein